ncbi:MAG: hypothetical protein FJ087_11315 [Deltaproteobacteria bacterium]|nr:hypothetical protein [Deltaproteobacteria bacterium]
MKDLASRIPVLFALAAVSAVACGRVEEESWVVEPPALPLLESLTFTDPAESPLTIRRAREPDGAEALKVRSSHEVRVRGRMLPAMVTSVRGALDVAVRTASVDGDEAVLEATVGAADVSMDPEIEGASDDMQAGFRAASIRLAARAGRPLEARAAAGRAQTATERELAESLQRLLPALPATPAAAGDAWAFDLVLPRVPTGGRADLRLHGRYVFRGMTEFEGRTWAGIVLEYAIAASGVSSEGGVQGVLTGEGAGKGVFLVDPATGVPARCQVAETTLLRIHVEEKGRRADAEQFSRLALDLDAL